MFISYLSGLKKSKETVIFVALKVQFQSLSSINRTHVFLGFPCGSAGKESACLWKTWVWSLGWKDPLEKGKVPLQYSGLENYMDCIVHGFANGWTRLSNFCFHFHQNTYTLTCLCNVCCCAFAMLVDLITEIESINDTLITSA